MKTPWHLWVVGGVALLWNLFGLYDLTMSAFQGEAYYRASGMSEELVAYYVSRPGWVYAPWVVGVVGGLAGSLLLLMRRRQATLALLLSLAGSVVSNATGLFLAPEALTADGMWIMPAAIFGVCVLLVLYARRQQRRGLLA